MKHPLTRAIFVSTLLAVISGCAATMDTGSHCSVDPNFLGTENTFTWSDSGAIKLIDESGYISPAIVEQLKSAVVSELGDKGFRFVAEPTAAAPVDVRVQLYLRARREMLATTNNGYPCNYPDCWRPASNSSVQMDVHTIGFLAADVYYQDKPIWRGWVERNLFPSERDKAAAVIEQAVPALFETFPP